MIELQFNIYFCGMSDETFTDEIMIYRPNSSMTKTFCIETLCEAGISQVSELISYIKTDLIVQKNVGAWRLENLSVSTVYVRCQDYLLGLQEDKNISSIFKYFNANKLEFSYFIVGGASIHNETSYRFTIHSNEKIHENMPHVHVSKAEVEIRYSLETLLPIDPLIRPHSRDNRRIITPFLKKNQEKLMEMWRHYMNGYITPEITDDSRQFYSES